MGQQQLLLLVLGIVIVGLAVVVGIQAFDESNTQAVADALTMDGIRVVTAAKAWKDKPASFGGGADESNWANFTLADVSLASPYVTTNGSCTIGTAASNATLQVTCTSTDPAKVARVSIAFANDAITTVIDPS